MTVVFRAIVGIDRVDKARFVCEMGEIIYTRKLQETGEDMMLKRY